MHDGLTVHLLGCALGKVAPEDRRQKVRARVPFGLKQHALAVGTRLRALLGDVSGDVDVPAEVDLIVTALQAGCCRLERVVARGENRAVELRRYEVEVALRKTTGPTLLTLGVRLCAVEVSDRELGLLDQICARGQERGIANRRGPGPQQKSMLRQLHKLGRERFQVE